MMKWCLVPIILLLSSCSAEWHLSRAIKKNPELLATKMMTVTDTVVTEPIVVKDTVIVSQVDTIELIKDKFHLKIVRSYDTLMIEGGCDADTIFKTIEVPVKQVVYKAEEKWYQKIYRYTFLMVLIAIGTWVIRVILKKGLIGK